MEKIPAITPEDVARYRRLRTLGGELTGVFTKMIPKAVMSRVARNLGIERDGVLCFDSMDVPAVLLDCCLYDWTENGRNLMQKYIDAHPAVPGTDEHALFESYGRSRFRIITTETVVAGAGVYCLDLLCRERFFLMDIGLSRSLGGATGAIFATRTFPVDWYWVTGGAALSIVNRKAGEMILRMIERERLLDDKTPEGEHRLALAVIRACLDSGSADHIQYGELTEDEQEEWIEPSPQLAPSRRHPTISRNDPCPCGSGKKYKRCCLGK